MSLDNGYQDTVGMIKVLADSQRDIIEAVGRLGVTEIRYHMEKFNGYVRGLFARAPWQPGDRAHIKRDIDVRPESGWYAHREWLVLGYVGKVLSIDFDHRTDRFTCLWQPEDQRWKGEPITSPYCFQLNERDVERSP